MSVFYQARLRKAGTAATLHHRSEIRVRARIRSPNFRLGPRLCVQAKWKKKKRKKRKSVMKPSLHTASGFGCHGCSLRDAGGPCEQAKETGQWAPPRERGAEVRLIKQAGGAMWRCIRQRPAHLDEAGRHYLDGTIHTQGKVGVLFRGQRNKDEKSMKVKHYSPTCQQPIYTLAVTSPK